MKLSRDCVPPSRDVVFDCFSMELLDTYCYARLKTSTNIRLVRLLPPAGENDNQLNIELLEHTHVSANGTYTALSYVCGDTSVALRQPVLCEGRKIMIYPTLHSALLKLRHHSEPKLIWCDGLCIDQGQEAESLKERSQQVQMMFEIYSAAQKVAIDLGNDLGERHRDFIDALYQLVAISTKCYKSVAPYTFDHVEDMEENEPEGSASPENSHSITSLMNILPASVRQKWLWRAFADLLRRPYFRRLWVIQEHALGREVFFMLGRTEIPGPILARGVNRLYNVHNICSADRNEVFEAQSGIDLPVFDSVDKIFKTRHFRAGCISDNSWNNLDTLVYQTIAFDCFDNRDKLYGLLGLCRPDERCDPALRVDYNEPFGSFVLRLSLYFLSHGAPFVLYRSVGCHAAYSPSEASWAINLAMRTNDYLSALIGANGACNDDLFNAGNVPTKAIKTSFQPSFSIDATSQQLIVSAVLLPALNSVSPALSQSMEDPNKSISVLSMWLRNLSTWAFEQFSAIDTNATAILATITADTFRELGRFYRASRYAGSTELALIFAAFRKWISYINGSRAIDAEYAKAGEEAIPLASSLIYAYGRRVANSVMIQGGESLLFLVPESARPGDVIAVFVGLPLPFVLRPAGLLEAQPERPAFRIVGSAYVHGLMDGQVFNGSLSEQRIILV